MYPQVVVLVKGNRALFQGIMAGSYSNYLTLLVEILAGKKFH